MQPVFIITVVVLSVLVFAMVFIAVIEFVDYFNDVDTPAEHTLSHEEWLAIKEWEYHEYY
jgi:hypothetical protein